MKKVFRFLSVAALLVVAGIFSVTSCASTDFRTIEEASYHGDYYGALNYLENSRDYLYSDKDTVLYSLDTGMLDHYAGEWQESNSRFSEAEQLIDKLYTKSVSQSVSSFFVNDYVIDYAGEDYEDIYTNLFMALNYIHLGQTEDAFVEIRRFDSKLRDLENRYSQLLQDGMNSAPVYDGYTFEESQFHNSALARYISMLLYRAKGDISSATIDRRYIRNAFISQRQLYPFSEPASLDEEIYVPSGMARLNVLAFAGLGPEKVAEDLRLFDRSSRYMLKISLPEIRARNSSVSYIQVTAKDKYGRTYYTNLDLLENIDLIAEDTFARKQGLIYLKSVLRSGTKALTNSIWGALAEAEQEKDGTFGLFSMISLVSAVSYEVTEVADTRTSRFFPSKAYVGGLTLPPGVYDVSVVYKNPYGKTLDSLQYSDVAVRSDSLNLVEAICSK